jgi:hypothetical protein
MFGSSFSFAESSESWTGKESSIDIAVGGRDLVSAKKSGEPARDDGAIEARLLARE